MKISEHVKMLVDRYGEDADVQIVSIADTNGCMGVFVGVPNVNQLLGMFSYARALTLRNTLAQKPGCLDMNPAALPETKR